MHSNKMIHRDFKSENVMINWQGITKLADFGLSLDLSARSSEICFTFAGTEVYMAPELFALSEDGAVGYSYPVDWWALGITLYECFTKLQMPFPEEDEDAMRKVIMSKRAFAALNSSKIPDPEALDFLKDLLKKSPKQRLGTKNQPGVK